MAIYYHNSVFPLTGCEDPPGDVGNGMTSLCVYPQPCDLIHHMCISDYHYMYFFYVCVCVCVQSQCLLRHRPHQVILYTWYSTPGNIVYRYIHTCICVPAYVKCKHSVLCILKKKSERTLMEKQDKSRMAVIRKEGY